MDDVTGSAGGGSIATDDWPDEWRQGEHTFSVTYRFDPGDPRDGVSVHIPISVLNQVDSTGFDWQVPGLRSELVAALVRTLPKQLRRSGANRDRLQPPFGEVYPAQ